MSHVPRILLISHRGRHCGVQQFGRRLFQVQSRNATVDWRYAECASVEEFLAECAAVGASAVVVNHHDATSPWAENPRVRECGIPCFAIVHEGHQLSEQRIARLPFDRLLYADPTYVPRVPIVIPVPRFIPAPRPAQPEPETFTIGTFGFPTLGKGMERLCGMVNEQFDHARIRINLAPHDSIIFTPEKFVQTIIDQCQNSIRKKGIELEISRDFFTEEQLLDFLSENTINAFLYESATDAARGISSCTDYALAAGRPIAVSNSGMFRHLHGVMPTISAERRSLGDIAASGIKPLAHHIARYEPAAAARAWNEAIFKALGEISITQDVPDGRGFNKIVIAQSIQPQTGDDRRASLAQLFVLDALERLSPAYFEPRILVLGQEDEPLISLLKSRGYACDQMAPEALLGGQIGSANSPAYDIIGWAPSVNEPEYLFPVALAVRTRLLPSGVAIFGLTCGPLENTDHDVASSWPEKLRKFTLNLADCVLLGTDSWHELYGEMPDSNAVFAWTFRKMDEQAQRNRLPPTRQPTANFLLPADAKLKDLGTTHRIGFTQGRHCVEGSTSLLQLSIEENGYLSFGPYMPLNPGSYTSYFLLRLDTPSLPDETPLALLDLVLDQVEDGRQLVVTAGDLRHGLHKVVAFDFATESPTAAFECRVRSLGAAGLSLVATFALRAHAPLAEAAEVSEATV